MVWCVVDCIGSGGCWLLLMVGGARSVVICTKCVDMMVGVNCWHCYMDVLLFREKESGLLAIVSPAPFGTGCASVQDTSFSLRLCRRECKWWGVLSLTL